MENNSSIQLRMSSNLPAIPTAQSLAQIRMSEESYPHYRNIPVTARQKWLANQIQYLASITRIRDFEAREPIIMATALDDMMAQDAGMANLTLPEIADAFKNGVFGIYGEFYGITAPNLYGFLDSFLKSEKKKEATAIVLKSKEQLYAEKKAAEKSERDRKLREEIEEAKRNGSFVPTGKVWFEPKKVENPKENDRAHREMVREQAKEILRYIPYDTNTEGGRDTPASAHKDTSGGE